MTTSFEARVMDASEKIWDAVDGIVLVKEINGCKQRISIDTINGKKVRCFANPSTQAADVKEKVDAVFPNGLPEGINAIFVSVAA